MLTTRSDDTVNANHSFDTAGLDDPGKNWMQHLVRVPRHPEWGTARVLRFYPAEGGEPVRLRIMAEGARRPQVVRADEIEVIGPATR
jgi:hypothetical protein